RHSPRAGFAAAGDDRRHGAGHRVHHHRHPVGDAFRVRHSDLEREAPMTANLPRRRQRGFTILEIVIVFILLAGIMAFVGPKIFEQMGRAKSQEARIRIQHLAGQIEIYKLEVGKYPENLQALVKQPAGIDKWNGPYVKEDELKDAWGNDYRYTV